MGWDIAPNRPRRYPPVPLRRIVCGLPLPLSLIEMEAVRLPVAAGLNVTLIVQLAPAASELPQPFVTLKSDGSAPAKETLLMSSAVFATLVNVTVWAGLV